MRGPSLSDTKVKRAIFGVDFTSAPSRRKTITVARGSLLGSSLCLYGVDHLTEFSAFESFLDNRVPWTAGFDFPFGLPRELIAALRWPTDWATLVTYTHTIGKDAFRDALTAVRQSRPMGARYIHRTGDRVAGSSSPMKLVNPPVGLMFFEGAIRLLRAGISIVPCMPSADDRIALEAYPGFLARQITRASYKKDGRSGATPERRAARTTILSRLLGADICPNICPHWVSDIDLAISFELQQQCVSDGTGDTLDAVLCAVQAAVAQSRFDNGDTRFGIPTTADPLEGWIATVPAP